MEMVMAMDMMEMSAEGMIRERRAGACVGVHDGGPLEAGSNRANRPFVMLITKSRVCFATSLEVHYVVIV